MEQQTPILPPKSRMKPREGQKRKRAIFPSLIWGGGGGGQGFSFILSQIGRFYTRGRIIRPDG